MQRTSILKSNFNHKNLVFYVLFFAFFIGMSYGALLAHSNESGLFEQISGITQEYQLSQSTQPLGITFWNSFLSVFLFLLVPYFFGYSALGQMVTIGIPLFKGLGLGCALGSLYLQYGIKGVTYSALLIVPYTVIALFGILIACRESIRLSNLFFFGMLSKSENRVDIHAIRLYNIKFLILCGIGLLSSLINVITTLLFSKMFQI